LSRSNSPRLTRNTTGSQLSIDSRADTRRTSLILPDNLPLEAWKGLGLQLTGVSDSSAWWLGDWLVYGQDNYPNRYRHAVTLTSLDYQTLRNYASVARRFPPTRRRPCLSFQHHAEVVSLPEDSQSRWLDLALEHGWSRNRLRASLKTAADLSPSDVTATVQIKMEISMDQMNRWRQAASQRHSNLNAWIVEMVDKVTMHLDVH
jgi:hypothetical protein